MTKSFGEHRAASRPGEALNAIAKRAGVANATLYRHFPTRESLVLEVYRHEVRQLVSLLFLPVRWCGRAAHLVTSLVDGRFTSRARFAGWSARAAMSLSGSWPATG